MQAPLTGNAAVAETRREERSPYGRLLFATCMHRCRVPGADPRGRPCFLSEGFSRSTAKASRTALWKLPSRQSRARLRADDVREQDLLLVTDAGFITVIIGVGGNELDLDRDRELQEEDRAVTDQLSSLPWNRRLGAEWDLPAVSFGPRHSSSLRRVGRSCSNRRTVTCRSPACSFFAGIVSTNHDAKVA